MAGGRPPEGVEPFEIGDRIVYPIHGAGVIEAVEEREVLGERAVYYVMKLPLSEMRVMFPLSRAMENGIRPVIDRDDAERVLDVLGSGATAMSTNWNERYRGHMDRIRSGDIMGIAGIVRNLSKREGARSISTGERKILNTARQLLVNEMVLAQGVGDEPIRELLECIL